MSLPACAGFLSSFLTPWLLLRKAVEVKIQMQTQREALERTNWKTNSAEQGEKACDIHEIVWLERAQAKRAGCVCFPRDTSRAVSSSIFEGFLGYSAHVAPSDYSFEVCILMRGCLGRSQLVACQARRRMEGAGRLPTQCAALGVLAPASPRGVCSGPQTLGHLPEKRRFLERQPLSECPPARRPRGLFAASRAC